MGNNNTLNTAFATSGFSNDPNLSPNNQSFGYAVLAVVRRAGLGGGGGVTSVAGTSIGTGASALVVTGSPITTSGTLTFALKVFDGTNAGVVPASAGGTLNYLRADGSYAQPPSGGAGTFSGPTNKVSTTGTAGTSTAAMRSDGAPAIDQGMSPTWTGVHTFTPTALDVTALQVLNTAGTSKFHTMVVRASSTGSQSYGLAIKAGVNASDDAFLVQSQAGTGTFFQVLGDGGAVMGSPTGGDQGAGSLNVSGNLFVNGVACGPGSVTEVIQGTGIITTVGTLTATGTVSVDATWAPTWTGDHTFTPAAGVGVTVNASNTNTAGLVVTVPYAASALTNPTAIQVKPVSGTSTGAIWGLSVLSGTNGGFAGITIAAGTNTINGSDLELYQAANGNAHLTNGGGDLKFATGTGTTVIADIASITGQGVPSGFNNRQVFVATTGATQTYTIPPFAQLLHVICVGGGGGGGGGIKAVGTNTACSGGGGGGGGGISASFFHVADLGGGGAQVTITFSRSPGGGTGGPGLSGTLGTAGGLGGTARFGTYLYAYPGAGGASGANNSSAGGGAGGAGSIQNGLAGGQGAAGANGGAPTQQATLTLATTMLGNIGGGAGGGISAAQAAFAGGMGGTNQAAGFMTYTGGTGGANTGANGGPGVGGNGSWLPATGGGGGGAKTSATGGTGGAGGNYGAGGGGGGCVLNASTASGAGGAGGDAAVIILAL